MICIPCVRAFGIQRKNVEKVALIERLKEYGRTLRKFSLKGTLSIINVVLKEGGDADASKSQDQ